ncbi:MAG: sulfotransferase, partial [Acidimicrobiia bacterium]|nr:sulfotransferase [Acidimicrobiia bacterium]
MASQRLGRDRLVEEAIRISGHDDLGPAHWEEGLDRLLGALEDEGRLSEIGVEVAATTIVGHLVTRAGLLAWRRDHPEVATEEISAPIVIVGQPRTGTTI